MKPTFKQRLLFGSISLALAAPSAYSATVTYNTETLVPTAWTCPAGVTSIQVECWGGGGAGGSGRKDVSTASNTSQNGGGGGGGAYSRKASIPVTPGSSYTIIIPAAAVSGSLGTTTNGQGRVNGASVTFVGDLGATVTAAGGTGGANAFTTANSTVSVSGGAGGTAAASLGDSGALYAGGAGAASTTGATNYSGGGGGGAGNAAAGSASTSKIGAAGGIVGGGAGGDGRGDGNTNPGAGAPGVSPGGGGGGGHNQGANTRLGGLGGLGQIIITYDDSALIVKDNNPDNLDLTTSWVGGVVPGSTVRAKWDGTVTGANTTVLGTDATWGGIQILNPGGLVTIDAGNTLTLGGSVVDVDMSAATQDLTLNSGLALGAANVWDVANGRTLTLGGVVSGSTSIVKQGGGTAILAGANTFTGNTTVSGGTLIAAGGSASTAQISVGTMASKAVLNVPTGGTLNGGNSITVGTSSGSSGAVNINGGTLTTTADSDSSAFGAADGGYGAFTMSSAGSIFTQPRFMFGGIGSTTTGGAVGVGLITDGTVNSSNWMILSRNGASTGILTITGGLINHAGAANSLVLGLSGTGRAELNVNGGQIDNTGKPINMGGNGSFHWTGTGLLNLNGGTVITDAVVYDANVAAITSNSYVNFSGGTLQASAASTSFLPAFVSAGSGINQVFINGSFGSFLGGATINTNGFNSTVSANLLAPTGNGVTSLSLDSQGSGYIGAPAVKILDNGLPSTATAYAVVDTDSSSLNFGKVTNVVITNPGVIVGTATVSLIGGGGSGAAVSVSATGPNSSGGLTKSGLGTLTLSGANTYTGPTLVSNGALQLNGSAAVAPATSSLTVASTGTLGFTAGAASSLGLTGSAALGGGTIGFDLGSTGVNDIISVNSFALTANSAFTFNQINAVTSGATYTLLSSTNPITNSGPFTISGQVFGKLTLTPVINANTITVTPVLDEGGWNQPGSGNWNVSGNWTPYQPTAAGDAALFGAAITGPATVTVDSLQSAGYLRFDNANSYTIGSNGSSNLTIDNGVYSAFAVVSAGSHTIAENVTLASNLNVSPVLGTTLAISGNLSGAGTSLQLTDAGTLVLSGTGNSYTGSTTVNAGTLSLTGSLNGGGALVVNGSGILSESSTGVISGATSLTHNSSGTSILAGANTYTGGTTINTGTLQLSGIGTPGAVGSAVAVSSGALLDLNGTNQSVAFTAGSGAGIVANNSGSGISTLTLSANPLANVIIRDNTNSTSGKVAVVIAVTSQALNAANTYSGGTTVNAGTYLYTGNPTGAGTGPINLTTAGAGVGTGSGFLVNGEAYANDITGAGYVHNNSNSGATVVTTTLTGNINTSGPFIFRAGTGIVYNFAGNGTISSLSGVIGSTTSQVNGAVATGSIIKSGTGTLTLSGTSVYTGSTTLTGGILRATTSAAALGAGALSLGGGTLQLTNDSALNFGRNTTVTANSTIISDTLISGPGVPHTLGTLSIGTFQLDVAPGVNATGSTAGITFGATTISGTSSNATFSPALNSTLTLGAVTGTTPTITKVGAGSLVLSGTITTAAALTINDGSVTMNTNNSTAQAALTVNSPGTLNFNNGQIFGVLNGNGTINQNTNFLYTRSASDGVFNGTITGTGGYTKDLLGGTQTLTGVNTYTGPTTVTAGTLALVGGSQASAITVTGASLGFTLNLPTTSTSSVTFNAGSTVKITGTPTLASYTLMTASSFGGITPVLAAPIAGYELKVDGGNTLKLVQGGYSSWASLNGASLNLNDDHDFDGVPNGIEYFIGGPNGITTGFTALPGVVNTAGTLSITWPKAATYTGTYGTNFSVETSSTLTGVWTTEIADPNPGFTVTFPSATEVKYTFPPGTTNFARLKVTGP